MTQWSGTSGHMQVGINVLNDAYDTNTPSINVYVEYWVRSVNWGYGDNQRLEAWGSASGGWDYYFNVGSGIQDRHISTITIYGQGQSYGGGPTYTFGARVTGAYDGSSPSLQINWTLPARPPNVPTNPPVVVDSVTSSTAAVHVFPADPRGAGIDAYETAVSRPGLNQPDWSGWSQSWGGGSGNATNLEPNRVYEAAARAHNAMGWSAWTYSGYFRTGARVPDAPGSLTRSNIGQASADFKWNAPYDGGSAVLGYQIQLSTAVDFSVGIRNVDLGNVTSATVASLTPGVRYWGRTRARNGVGWSAWSNVVDFTTLSGTPVIVNPTQDSTVRNGWAYVQVQAQGIASDRTITVQIADNSAFTTNLRTLTLDPPGARSDNTYTLSDPNIYLKNGGYYARAQVKNNTTGYITPWSSTVYYIQSHTPVATPLSHHSGSTYAYNSQTVFQYRFDDAANTVDQQSAYRLLVEVNDSGETIFDSGKVATNTAGTNRSIAVPISDALKNRMLRWRIMVWDRGDVASAWSGYNLFTLSDIPVVSIQNPTSATPTDSGAPEFRWTISVPSGGKQATATLRVFDASNNSLIWEYVLQGEATRVTPPIVILRNESQYYVTLDVVDSVGLSASTSTNFTTSYQAPSPIAYEVNVSLADEMGFSQVAWASAAPDALFVTWKVYRRSLSGDWELISTIPNQNVREYRDQMVVAGDRYIYSVTQVATRSGVFLESPVGYYLDLSGTPRVEDRSWHLDLTYYWLINPDQPETSIRLLNVISDDSTLEFESESYHIIGRGRHRDYGDELGYKGTLVCQVNSVERPSTFRMAVERLRRTQESYFLRTPFGRLFQVALGDIGWSPRAGTGVSEMGELTIPYEEVK